MRIVFFFLLLFLNSCLFTPFKQEKISNKRISSFKNKKFIFDNEISKYGLIDNDTLVDIGFSNTIHDEIIKIYYPNLHFILEDVKPMIKFDEYYQTSKNKELISFKNNCQIIKGSYKQIPLPSSKYKFVLCRNSLHEFKDKSKMISEMKRIIRNDGCIILIEERSVVKDQICGQGHKLISEEELQSFFLSNGLILKYSEIIYRQTPNSPMVIYKLYKN